jgi:hypothetical protein
LEKKWYAHAPALFAAQYSGHDFSTVNANAKGQIARFGTETIDCGVTVHELAERPKALAGEFRHGHGMIRPSIGETRHGNVYGQSNQ